MKIPFFVLAFSIIYIVAQNDKSNGREESNYFVVLIYFLLILLFILIKKVHICNRNIHFQELNFIQLDNVNESNDTSSNSSNFSLLDDNEI